MKARFLSSLIALCIALGAEGAIISVNNNSSSPGQYSNLQMAINNSSPGDTIMVAGSNKIYEKAPNTSFVTVDKSLTIIGSGYNNIYGLSTKSGFYIHASHVTIMGFEILNLRIGTPPGPNTFGAPIEDLTILRCRIVNNFSFVGEGSATPKLTIRRVSFYNNIITTPVKFWSTSGFAKPYIHLDTVDFQNNLFSSSWVGTIPAYQGDLTGAETLSFSHNLFLSQNNATFQFVSGVVNENNLFYGANPQGCNNCVFVHNLTFQTVNDTIPGPDNVPSTTNLIGVDPMFINYPGGGFSFQHNYMFQSGSTAINAASNGSDIGISGGNFPFLIGANPAIPQIQYLNIINATVPKDSTLFIDFKAIIQH